MHNLLHIQNNGNLNLDATRGLKLGAQLRELLVGICIGLEEVVLAVPELLSEGTEALVVEEGLVGGQLQELRIS